MEIYQGSKELKIVLFPSEFSNLLPKAAGKPLFLCYFIFSTTFFYQRKVVKYLMILALVEFNSVE
ncbi:hypothetical protein [Enterococcus sp. 2201sp1_2201st1_B8_2201SCRN_220225]|uniref:hypothetical protein n=1 Tax=unclassified Enterococcus TaxID=2608891 RepID=UPI0034A18E1E